MTLSFLSQKKRVVGLDFFHEKIVGFVAEHLSQDVEPCHVFEINCSYEDEAELIFSQDCMARLRESVTGLKLRGKPVVLSVPNHHVVVRYLPMPGIPQKALRQAVQVEIGTTIHLPFEDPIVDVIAVPDIDAIHPSAEKTDGCCLIASPRSVISNLMNLVKQAGLVPVAVDMRPLALMRAARTKPLSSEGLTLLARVGESETALSIFIGPYLYFFRNMDMGIQNDILNEDTIQTAVADFVYELNRVINFFNFNLANTDRPLTQMYLYGSHPRRELIAQGFERQLGVPVSSIRESEFLDGLGYRNSEAMIAAGLAMKRGQTK